MTDEVKDAEIVEEIDEPKTSWRMEIAVMLRDWGFGGGVFIGAIFMFLIVCSFFYWLIEIRGIC